MAKSVTAAVNRELRTAAGKDVANNCFMFTSFQKCGVTVIEVSCTRRKPVNITAERL